MDALTKYDARKNYVKKICRILWYFGMGNCWFENQHLSKVKKCCYYVWMAFSISYIILFDLNICSAFYRSDLSEVEENDLIQFIIAQTVIGSKILIFLLKKKQIQEFLYSLLEGSRGIIETENLDKICLRKCVRLTATIGVSVYFVIIMTTFDGVRAHLLQGIPIRTEVTYYPPVSASGLAVNILRFFIQLHWWFVVSIMAAIDSLCISALVIVGFKFKVLEVYFANLRKKIVENAKIKSRSELEKIFTDDFIIGIKMHDDALWCAKNVQTTLGNLYSVQICESVVLLVMCLIKLVTVERNVIFLIANFAYISCLALLTGAYMLPAGDITHEASMVSTWIFHSGWELVSSRDVRVLAVLALQRGQVPVIMTAFGILTLSYSNFISVIRSSYSFFAVMY